MNDVRVKGEDREPLTPLILLRKELFASVILNAAVDHAQAMVLAASQCGHDADEREVLQAVQQGIAQAGEWAPALCPSNFDPEVIPDQRRRIRRGLRKRGHAS